MTRTLTLAAALVAASITTAHADNPLSEAFQGGWCVLVRDAGGLYVRPAYCGHLGPNNCEAVRLQAVVRRSSPAGFVCLKDCCYWATE